MKRIIWQMPDGSVRVTIPCSPVRDNESEKDYLNRVAQKCRPEGGIRVTDLDVTDIPSDRTYRNAWSIKNGKIEIDAVKKQKIDDDKRQREIDTLVLEEMKTVALDSLKKKGVI